MIQKTIDYINQNQNRFLDELQQFLRFPSVSAQATHKKDLIDCAKWLTNHLTSIGLDARLIETDGHPIVRASGKGKTSRQVIIYGHYDVQPEDPLDQWLTPPFEPAIRDGYLYARGATDDKGQLFAHVKAVESLLQTQGQLPCEVLFLLEGEEECGGEALPQYIRQEKNRLDPCAVVVSDCSMYDENTPAITYGLRGIAALEFTLKGPNADLHSGSFGGAVANPAVAASRIISQCIDPDGKILIPNFYDDVVALQDWERDNIAKLNFNDQALADELGVGNLAGEPEYTALERMWARPTCDVNGMFGGYTGQGGKTIIPASATAKLSFRLVPNQDPKKIASLITQHLKSLCPKSMTIEVSESMGAQPVLCNVENPAVEKARQALEAGFGAQAVYIRCGGSIPVVNTFWQELQKPVVLMGFGLDTDGAHGPNERFKINSFINGAKASAHYLTLL